MDFFLEGRIPSKKNSKMIVTNKRTNRPMVLSSTEYCKWEKWAVLELMSQSSKQKLAKHFACCDVCIGITFPDNRRTDLSNKAEGVMDALVKAAIIEDDCWQVARCLTIFVLEGEVGAHVSVVKRDEK